MNEAEKEKAMKEVGKRIKVTVEAINKQKYTIAEAIKAFCSLPASKQLQVIFEIQSDFIIMPTFTVYLYLKRKYLSQAPSYVCEQAKNAAAQLLKQNPKISASRLVQLIGRKFNLNFKPYQWTQLQQQIYMMAVREKSLKGVCQNYISELIDKQSSADVDETQC